MSGRTLERLRRILPPMQRIPRRLSYANVTATIALFIALGGTSYAVTALPRNSVGQKQIRKNAVGATELRSASVRSSEIKRRSIRLDDVSLSARRSLRGQTGPSGSQGPPGPAGVPFTAAVAASGDARSATATNPTTHLVSGHYEVKFNRDMTACYAVATISQFSAGTAQPENGEIVTQTTGSGVTVRTRNSSGQPTDLPFHLIVVC
jgi:hypothetical protein